MSILTKCFLVVSIFALAIAKQAQADTLPASASTGVITAPWNVTLGLRQFDPALGTLDSIQYQVNGVLQAEVTLRNNSSFTDYTSLNASATLNVSLPGAPITLTVFPSGSGSNIIFGHSSGTLYAGGSDSTSGTLTGNSMQAYIGKGYVALPASSSSVSTYVSSSSSVTTFSIKQTELNVSVTYNYHLNTATVSGRLALEGVTDLTTINPAVPLGTFHIEFRIPNTITVAKAVDLTLTPVGVGSPYGRFSVSGITPGTYDIAIKGHKNLRVLLSNVVATGSLSLPDQILPSGDANDDNSVDSSDFGIIINAYNRAISIPGSGYDPRTDFNYDGLVDMTDFSLLVSEYNNTGRP